MNKIICFCAVTMLLASSAFAQNDVKGKGRGPGNGGVTQDPYRQQMQGLMEEMRGATTKEQRDAVQVKMKQARDTYQAAHPVKELTAAEKAEQKQKMEEMLKKDPFRWQMYQLQQSMSAAKTQAERDTIRTQMQTLRTQHEAEEEAKLTPEQKAERAARAAKNAQMQAELKPIMEQMRSAKTEAERKAIHDQMQEVMKKYR